MIFLQLLDLKELGCTEEEAVMAVIDNPTPGALECQLMAIDPSWKVPLNLTCVNGALEPSMGIS